MHHNKFAAISIVIALLWVIPPLMLAIYPPFSLIHLYVWGFSYPIIGLIMSSAGVYLGYKSLGTSRGLLIPTAVAIAINALAILFLIQFSYVGSCLLDCSTIPL